MTSLTASMEGAASAAQQNQRCVHLPDKPLWLVVARRLTTLSIVIPVPDHTGLAAEMITTKRALSADLWISIGSTMISSRAQ